MAIFAEIADALRPVADLVYPPRCPLCGAGIAAQKGLCATCWSGLRIPTEPGCSLCQRPFDDPGLLDGTVCSPCLADPPRHDGIAAGTIYNDTSRKLILAFKHGRRIALVSVLARLMAARLPELEGDWSVIPVPLHRGRLWRRGFNQAALLAHELTRQRGLALMVDGLERIRATPSLGGQGKNARSKILAGAIRVTKKHQAGLKGQRIVLVDDVLTSGATSNACVSVLKRAGAERVVIACFARVLSQVVQPDSRGINETPEV